MSDMSAAIIKFTSNNKDEKANMTPMYLSLNGTVYIQWFSSFQIHALILFLDCDHANFIL